jgi:4-amino-4-deoxy-L-arabinose transferase-like glycosyltransferase
MAERRRELAILLCILAIAGFFRLYQITSVPPGLYPDEAMNGNNALQAIDTGDYKLFYPENNGREGLFINIQAQSLKIFGIHPWSLRIVSAVFGILTVLGLYLLTREIFDKNIAYLAAFLLSISSWHVTFSRIGFRAIMLPFVLVFLFYFLWRGIRRGHYSDFIMSGIFGGLGFYTYISYRVAPLIILILGISYWLYLKKDFAHDKYEHTRNKLLKGFGLLTLTVFIIALPIGVYFLMNPGDFIGRTGSNLSVFGKDKPLLELSNSVFRTLVMFNFSGDYNWRHNLAGSPMLSWPIGILFIVGFLRETIHWLRRKHGHFSPSHTFLLAWFFVMLLPGFLSTEAPHALRTIGVIPVVMIYSAMGLWWFFDKLNDWYKIADPHQILHNSRALTIVVMLLYLSAVGSWEYNRYFREWALDSNTQDAFSADDLKLAEKINTMDRNKPVYILVNRNGTLVNGIPMPSQTVMFLTDTFTAEKQKNKNIYYLTPEQYKSGDYVKKSIVIPLE